MPATAAKDPEKRRTSPSTEPPLSPAFLYSSRVSSDRMKLLMKSSSSDTSSSDLTISWASSTFRLDTVKCFIQGVFIPMITSKILFPVSGQMTDVSRLLVPFELTGSGGGTWVEQMIKWLQIFHREEWTHQNLKDRLK